VVEEGPLRLRKERGRDDARELGLLIRPKPTLKTIWTKRSYEMVEIDSPGDLKILTVRQMDEDIGIWFVHDMVPRGSCELRELPW
jgi:hypothetical protein